MSNFFNPYFFLSLFIFPVLGVKAQTISYPKDVHILIDEKGILKPKEILTATFQPTNQSIINFGNSKATFWIRFIVDTGTEKMSYLEIGNGMLDAVILYHKKANKLIASNIIGANYPKSQKYVAISTLLFPLPTSTENIYYLKIQSNFPIEVPMKIGSLQSFMENSHKKDLFFGTYLGIMLVMGLYNLFVYFSVRDKVYLYYVLYVWTIGAFYLHLKGYMFDIFWSATPAINFYTPIFSVLPILSIIIFCRAFLRTFQYIPNFDKVFFLFTVICVGCIIGNLCGDYVITASISQLISLITLLYILVCAIICHFKGSPLARYFLLAWLIYIVSVVIFILQVAGVTASTEFTSNSVLYGTMAEVVLLSFTLAYRINILKKEKEYAQAENLRIIREQNTLLEQKVIERTTELIDLNTEVKAQNEELLQTQEELTSQRDLSELQRIELETQHSKIKSSIHASKTIQQSILPSKQQLQNILTEYAIIYLPKDEVSGDFYWIQQVGKLRILACIDCTGHGVPGAFMTTIAHSLLNRIVLLEHIYSPAKILTRLHELVYETLRQGETTNQNGMDLVIISLKTLDNQNTELHFAGAKAHLYYNKSNTMEVLRGSRKSVGGDQNIEKTFQEHTLTLPAKTRVYLCTDGYIDQNDVHRVRIGEEIFLSILQDSFHETLEIQHQHLIEYLAKQMENTQQRDDILIWSIVL
ncbi:MAG: hypothetical protein EAZ31_08000 [Cytophagia bacterium]|nr:MAG: hypothetical protein EAZ31_08000 [Cytophagia bacterium]